MIINKRIGFFLLVLVMCILRPITASAQDRVALLISNWDYGSQQLPGVKEKVANLAKSAKIY